MTSVVFAKAGIPSIICFFLAYCPMSLPDYGALGFRDIIVTLDGAVAVVLINRGKQSVPQYYSRSIQKSHGRTYCRRNSFGVTLVADLIQAFDLFDRDDRVR